MLLRELTQPTASTVDEAKKRRRKARRTSGMPAAYGPGPYGGYGYYAGYSGDSGGDGGGGESINHNAKLGNVLQWPEVVNKVNSAMKATGWKGKRMSDDAFMFTTRGAEVEDQWYIAIIDNAGDGFFTYALGTVEEGDPHIDDAFKGKLPNTEASVSELMNEIRDGFGLNEQGVVEGKVINTYLWHGSRQKIPMLEPRQSVDTGGAAGSNQNAIYATSDPKVAIAMGLTTPGSDTGMFPNDPQMVLFSGKIRKGEYVYLHKLPFNGPDGKSQFVQGGNSREFHSIPGVESIKPIEIKEIPVNKYLNLIRKATPADLKLRKKYMKEQGVAENFADGKNPQDKGDSKRHGVPTKASVSTLRKVAKQGGRKGQLAHWMANMKAGKAKKNETLTEAVIHPSTMDALEDFLPFVMKLLKLDKLPRISVHKTIETGDQPSFGGYNPADGTIQLALKDRHPADVLRTLAHELVHFKQDQQGELDEQSGATGSNEENEANTKAGIIMRHFNKRFPQYLE